MWNPNMVQNITKLPLKFDPLKKKEKMLSIN